jgi:Tol biopolymer transport system component
MMGGILLVASFAEVSSAHGAGDLSVYRSTYNGEGKGVYAVHSDGGGKEKLSGLLQHGAYFVGQTELSPYGSRVAFDASPNDRTSNLYVAAMDGSETIRLTRGSRRDGDPSWSPNGKRIVADCGPICILDADGSGRPRKITSLGNGGDDPDWSPNGKRIAFAGGTGIVTVRPNGKDRVRVTNSPTSDLEPYWSPDSRWILFWRVTGHRSSVLMRVRANGTRQQELTDERAMDRELEWSPDGSKIVFIRTRRSDACGERWCDYLFVMNADGSHPRRLTGCFDTEPFSSHYPTWSPNGNRIAMIRRTEPEEGDPRTDVWALRVGTRTWRNLTKDRRRFTNYFGLDW